MNYYDGNLKSETKIVDLCSSWISHLPNQLNFKSVIGIGMNEKELKANKRLTKHYVVDLNKNPKLNMIKSESIDSVLCTVSVDYLIRVSFCLVLFVKSHCKYYSLNFVECTSFWCVFYTFFLP